MEFKKKKITSAVSDLFLSWWVYGFLFSFFFLILIYPEGCVEAQLLCMQYPL